MLQASDLHLYPSVPFVPSWSLMNAMACECAVLAADTEPAREIVQDGQNGRLVDFFDEDAWVRLSLELLEDPEARGALASEARRSIEQRYGAARCVPALEALFRETAAGPA